MTKSFKFFAKTLLQSVYRRTKLRQWVMRQWIRIIGQCLGITSVVESQSDDRCSILANPLSVSVARRAGGKTIWPRQTYNSGIHRRFIADPIEMQLLHTHPSCRPWCTLMTGGMVFSDGVNRCCCCCCFNSMNPTTLWSRLTTAISAHLSTTWSSPTCDGGSIIDRSMDIVVCWLITVVYWPECAQFSTQEVH